MSKTYRHLSLFSGAGGVDLGFKWAGIKTVAAVELKDYACETLKKNNPQIKVFGPPDYSGDVREFNKSVLIDLERT